MSNCVFLTSNAARVYVFNTSGASSSVMSFGKVSLSQMTLQNLLVALVRCAICPTVSFIKVSPSVGITLMHTF